MATSKLPKTSLGRFLRSHDMTVYDGEGVVKPDRPSPCYVQNKLLEKNLELMKAERKALEDKLIATGTIERRGGTPTGYSNAKSLHYQTTASNDFVDHRPMTTGRLKICGKKDPRPRGVRKGRFVSYQDSEDLGPYCAQIRPGITRLVVPIKRL